MSNNPNPNATINLEIKQTDGVRIRIELLPSDRPGDAQLSLEDVTRATRIVIDYLKFLWVAQVHPSDWTEAAVMFASMTRQVEFVPEKHDIPTPSED
jgi:hypothetical protein